MAPSKVQHLFVNKTARSPSLSNCQGDESDQRRLRQHAQRARHLRLGVKAKRRRGQISDSPLDYMTNSSELPYIVLELRFPGETKEKETAFSSDTQITASNRTGRKDDPNDNPRHELQTRENALLRPSSDLDSPSITPVHHDTPNSECSCDDPSQSLAWSNDVNYMLSSDSAIGPFESVALPLTAGIYQILHYFTTQYLPATTQDADNPCVSMPRPALEALIQDTMQLCLSDKLCTFALLAATTSRMMYVSHHRFPQRDLPVAFTQITLRLLRQRLAEGAPITEQLILAVKFLDAMEAYTFNWGVVLIHQKMIKHLGDKNFGGGQNLCYVVRTMFGSADLPALKNKAAVRMFQAVYKPKSPESQGRYDRMVAGLTAHDVLPLGAGFRLYTDHFTPQFCTLLDQIIELFTVLQCHWAGICPENTRLPDRAWVVSRSFELAEDLAALPAGANTENPFLLIQECLRLVLMYDMQFVPYTKTSVHRRPYGDMQAIVNTKPLKRALTLYVNKYHTENGVGKFHFGVDIRPLLLFIAEKGALLSDPIEDQEAFATFFQSLALECAISNFAEFKQIHQYFLWLDVLELANDRRIPRLFEKMETEVQAGRFDLGTDPERGSAATDSPS